MANVSYNLKNRGVRLISAEEAWVLSKKGTLILNPKYIFVGKIDAHMANMILSSSDKRKVSYRGDVSELNRVAKAQIVDYFFMDNGRRNKKYVAYLVIEKNPKKS